MLRIILLLLLAAPLHAAPLPGTEPLTEETDFAKKMVDGIHAYLDRATKEAGETRRKHWKPDYSSAEAYAKSVEPNRQRLREMLGVVEERVKFTDIEYISGPRTPALVAETDRYKVYAVSWPVLPGVDGEGLLLEPVGKVVGQVIAIGDADHLPEQLVGLLPGIHAESQIARRLAENGCRVVVPVLIDRRTDYSRNPALNRVTNIPHREFIHRMAYQMGRHLIGYELQKIFALVDWFAAHPKAPPIGIVGYGEGGMLAYYAGAIDTRIAITVASGHVGLREQIWQQPIDRNVCELTAFASDVDLIALHMPRALVIEHSAMSIKLEPAADAKGNKAASGSLTMELIDLPRSSQTIGEFMKLVPAKDKFPRRTIRMIGGRILSGGPDKPTETTTFFIKELAESLLEEFTGNAKLGNDGKAPEHLRRDFKPEPRQKRQFDQLVAHVQKLWRDSEPVRAKRFAACDYSSPEKYEASTEKLREFFHEEVIGKLPDPTLPMKPRSREIYDTPTFKGYEVTLDVYPDVFCYGILLMPKDIKKGEKRPVVVCQHGLSGRPTKVVDPEDTTKPYHAFGAELASMGYIVFAPQNPYIFEDHFRMINRKANPLKLSMFSFIVRQHERILDWLETLPEVDGKRMAFYGLSYGGKTAMRVPAVLKKYCLSICSGDFNEWIGKMISMNLDRGYMWTREWEMYEWNMGHTMSYAEMAALIAPRPFMVERGHDDGVGTDEMVAYEYAKVRYLYANRLGIPDRTAIEFFKGGHEINAKGTYAFLKQHLQFPK